MSPSRDTKFSEVLRRPLTVFLNEVDPQFASHLDSVQRDLRVRSHLHLALLLNASIAISDANALHSKHCHRLFSDEDGLKLLRPDDWLSEVSGAFEEVSPIRLCVRDTVTDLLELDRKEVEKYGERRPGVTAQDATLPRLLHQNAKDTMIGYSLSRCAAELTDYCRALFEPPAVGERDNLRHLDPGLAKRAIEDFQMQTARGGAYALGKFYNQLSSEPNGQHLQDEFLAVTKPGYQRGVPVQLGMPMTVAYRQRQAIEPTATLMPVPIQYTQSRLVTTEWGMDIVSELSTSQIMALRQKTAFKNFLEAKSRFMSEVLGGAPKEDAYGLMLNACEEYFGSLDRNIRDLAGLAQRSADARYAILLSKFTNQLTPTNCARGIFFGMCAGTAAASSYFAGNHCYGGNLEAVAANLGTNIAAIGGAAWAHASLQGSFTLSFSSEERRAVEESEAELWFHEPFQVSSYFSN